MATKTKKKKARAKARRHKVTKKRGNAKAKQSTQSKKKKSDRPYILPPDDAGIVCEEYPLDRKTKGSIAHQIVEIDIERDRLEKQVKELKEQREGLAAVLIQAMVGDGVKNIKLDGGATVYLRQDLKAHKQKDTDTGALLAALDSCEIDAAVHSYSVGKIKSWIREELTRREEQGETTTDPADCLPAALRELLSVYNVTQVGVSNKAAHAGGGKARQ
jgi:hypothetical protein|tara:strand:+ start:734 stop:1384 length:651 start_codon:yes stop_codon:yes gene_type:complete